MTLELNKVTEQIDEMGQELAERARTRTRCCRPVRALAWRSAQTWSACVLWPSRASGQRGPLRQHPTRNAGR